MAHYVDGFVIPLPKKQLNVYRHLAQKAGEYGWETTAPWTSKNVREPLMDRVWRHHEY